MSSVWINNSNSVSTSLIRHTPRRPTNGTSEWHSRNSTLLLMLGIGDLITISYVILFRSETRTYSENFFILRRTTRTIWLLTFSVLFVLHEMVLVFIFLDHIFSLVHIGISFIWCLCEVSSHTGRGYWRSWAHYRSTIVLQRPVVVLIGRQNIHWSRRSVIHLPVKRRQSTRCANLTRQHRGKLLVLLAS